MAIPHLGDDPPGPVLRLCLIGERGEDVADIRLLLQILLEGGHGDTSIGPHQDQGLGVGMAQLLDLPSI